MKKNINKWIGIFASVIVLMTTPVSVFAAIDDDKNYKITSSEELVLPMLETDNGQNLKEIKIIDEKTEDGNVITKAQLPFISDAF